MALNKLLTFSPVIAAPILHRRELARVGWNSGGCCWWPAASHPRKGKPVVMPGRKAIGPWFVCVAASSDAVAILGHGSLAAERMELCCDRLDSGRGTSDSWQFDDDGEASFSC